MENNLLGNFAYKQLRNIFIFAFILATTPVIAIDPLIWWVSAHYFSYILISLGEFYQSHSHHLIDHHRYLYYRWLANGNASSPILY